MSCCIPAMKSLEQMAKTLKYPKPMRVRGFYACPLPQLNHKPWRLARIPRENFRGAIRGAAARERLLYPSPAKAMQRKIRRRLVTAYVRRFGPDEFAAQFGEAKIQAQPRSNWLPNGYAWWRERIKSAGVQRE
jgi:hypothetical protein